MVMHKFDLFVSYSNKDEAIAHHVVEELEKRNFRCFYSPRDIEKGKDYAKEIVDAISNSFAMLLIFSKSSDNSGYVLREINSAVSRNKAIIPLKIEDFVPSEAMEFYLGVTQWLVAFPKVLDVHLDKIVDTVKAMKMTEQKDDKSEKLIKIVGPEIISVDRISEIGYDPKTLAIKEIEIDYLDIPADKYNMNEDIEGNSTEWENTSREYEKDTSSLLVINDVAVGYCDIYPVTDEAYEQLINGKSIIRDKMIDVYYLGGTFKAYIAMIGLLPEQMNQKNYILFFSWIITHLDNWKKDGIIITDIGISVYNSLLEKFVLNFGFVYKGINPAGGKIYETNYDKLLENPSIKKLITKEKLK